MTLPFVVWLVGRAKQNAVEGGEEIPGAQDHAARAECREDGQDADPADRAFLLVDAREAEELADETVEARQADARERGEDQQGGE